MKKKFTTFLGIFIASTLSTTFLQAQALAPQKEDAINYKRCGQIEYENYFRSQDPDFDKKRAEMEKTVQHGIAKIEQAKLNGVQPFTQYIIPIVVHVVWNTAAENVSDANITALIAQLNKDWSRTNTDAGNTPAAWQSIAANMDIQFCLAIKDPNGNPTNGIVRKQTSTTGFGANLDMQQSSTGGSDPWDVNKYLNIWICNYTGGLLGYGVSPPISSNYGTIIDYCNVNGSCPPFNMGRTLSHEIGHCFTLYHIWGDDGGSCSGDDGVSDTPNQADESLHSCPSFPKTDGCTSSSPGVMFMNYMDYATDACYNMFTQGQKAKCQSAVASFLMSIANNATTACGPTSALDAGINSITTPNGVVCNTTFAPVLTLKNYGANTLTSCTINYQIDANPNQTFNWSGSLATAQTINITLPSMSTSAGSHTFTSSTSSPNSSTDNNPGNDQFTTNFNVVSTGNPPIVEGIENATFPPVNWTLNNPDAGITWARTTAAKKTGTASMYMDNYDYVTNGQRDELISSPFNMLSATSAQLTFQVAYQMYSNPSSNPGSDSLKVDVSTNCGSTWTTVYNKYHTQLITATPQYSSNEFIPTASQWRLETVSLSPFLPASSMLVRFRHTTDWENNLYVDDINITSVVGMDELTIDNYVAVFPNPSTGTVHVNLNAMNLGRVNIRLYDLLGKTISEQSENTSSSKTFSFNLEAEKNGVYFVEVRSEVGKSIKKFMLNK